MNHWTSSSIEFANQRNYLDELYKIYPIIPNLKRNLPSGKESRLETCFREKNNILLIKELLVLDVFPVKDSYVAYFKRDHSAIERNPKTVDRIAGTLYQMGFDDMIENCIAPKETNRQIGPMFREWVRKKTLGAEVFDSPETFLKAPPHENAILCGSDRTLGNFAYEHLGYTRKKGLDFIARFNGKYIIGESKFLTDRGGHQNAQFEDAISTMKSPIKAPPGITVIPISILDGVLYIKGKNKLYRYLEEHPDDLIMSALVLREFLYSL